MIENACVALLAQENLSFFSCLKYFLAYYTFPLVNSAFSAHFLLVQKLLRALGLFAGSIVLMRQYGDLMAI